MIRVRMLKSAAGPNGSFPVHTTPLLDEDTALAFLEAGAAETFVPATKREKAAARPPVVLEPATETVGTKTREPDISIELRDADGNSVPLAPLTPPAEDPEELERQQMFKELVDGGTDAAEARALVWPGALKPENSDGVERAVVTPPETAVAAPQRPARRR
jgi:hypothetical protein